MDFLNRKSLKKKLKEGELTIGSWITLAHPAIGEIMATCGFDWLTIDMEHSAITLSDAQHLIQVIELAGCIPLVRVGYNDSTMIKRVMDAGAYGVIVPMVNSQKDAISAVNAVKYPPIGTRGVGLGRAQDYGLNFEQYNQWQSQESIVIVQIEHIDAVNEIDAILAVNGVDGFIVGPYDLSASLGVPGQFDHPSFIQAMEKITHVIQEKSGVIPGFHVVPPDISLVHEKVNEGYRFIAYSLDTLFLAHTCIGDLKKIKRDVQKSRTNN